MAGTYSNNSRCLYHDLFSARENCNDTEFADVFNNSFRTSYARHMHHIT